MSDSVSINLPTPQAPVVDPTSGIATTPWWYVFQRLLARTGGAQGVNVVTVQTTANTAGTAATAAQTTASAAATAAAEAQTAAGEASTTATAAQTTANGASTTATTAQTTADAAAAAAAAETARALAAEALLAPKASPTFSGTPPKFGLFPTFASDTAAAAGGIAVGQFYWNATAVVQRRV